MAWDEALLDAMPRLARPVLRFYTWSEPAASFGYFQKYAELERLTPLRPLVRRPTGGGLVPHDNDWTYSLVCPTNHAWYNLAAVASYRRVHEWLRDAFALLDEPTELAPQSSKSGPGQCFAGYEQFDLLWRGKKIAGAAQRRRRDGLLIQGSVQPPAIAPAFQADSEAASCRSSEPRRTQDASSLAGETPASTVGAPTWSRAEWERAMCRVAETERGVVWEKLQPDADLTRRAAQLAAERYGHTAYNRQR
jgi:lipoate-protein ligase A